MKLNSQKTVRFEAKELQRLARMGRPKKDRSIWSAVGWGFVVGLYIVALVRLILWQH